MYSKPTSIKVYKSSLTRKLINFAFHSGMIRFGRSLWSKSLTVVNYHRIDDPNREGFDTFKPNLTHPSQFDLQMQYLSEWFNVVSVHDVVNWLDGKSELPAYAALVTFDDGYLDNYVNAYPILRKYNFPALIFLPTHYIGTDNPFYWDLAAYCFYHTKLDHISLPDGREQYWTDVPQKEAANRNWIEFMKQLSEVEKKTWIENLPVVLDVSIPKDFFRQLIMSWDQVREMRKGGVEFGAHTITHPIMSRISLDQARTEIKGSKLKIEQEIGEDVLSFAYPNGLPADITGEVKRVVAEAGIKVAFTLFNGPSLLSEVKREPLLIRRIFVAAHHTLPQFALMVSRLNYYRS